MDSGPFDVLHYPRNENIFPVADGIDFSLLALQVLVDEDGVFGIQLDSLFDVAAELAGVVDYLHSPAAEDIAGADQHRVADVISHA
ncbi:hypothetical protein ES703_71406 [subsurface metagenome]